MPNYHPLNPKLLTISSIKQKMGEEQFDKHFVPYIDRSLELGLRVNVSILQSLLRKKDGTSWTWPTVKKWVRVYMEGKQS